MSHSVLSPEAILDSVTSSALHCSHTPKAAGYSVYLAHTSPSEMRQLTRVAPAHALHSASTVCRSCAGVEGSCSPSSSCCWCMMPAQACSRCSKGWLRTSSAASRKKCLHHTARPIASGLCNCIMIYCACPAALCQHIGHSECTLTCGCLWVVDQNSISTASAHPNICQCDQNVRC